MKLKQEHIRRILDTKQIPYEEIDVASPMWKQEKLFMQETLKLNDEDLPALPPQIFKDKQHRGVSICDHPGEWSALSEEFDMYNCMPLGLTYKDKLNCRNAVKSVPMMAISTYWMIRSCVISMAFICCTLTKQSVYLPYLSLSHSRIMMDFSTLLNQRSSTTIWI